MLPCQESFSEPISVEFAGYHPRLERLRRGAWMLGSAVGLVRRVASDLGFPSCLARRCRIVCPSSHAAVVCAGERWGARWGKTRRKDRRSWGSRTCPRIR